MGNVPQSFGLDETLCLIRRPFYRKGLTRFARQSFGLDETLCLIKRPFSRKARRRFALQSFGLDETLCLIKRPFSRSHSRSLRVLRLSCSALPLARATSTFTRPFL
jgi:hypothetical protein